MRKAIFFILFLPSIANGGTLTDITISDYFYNAIHGKAKITIEGQDYATTDPLMIESLQQAFNAEAVFTLRYNDSTFEVKAVILPPIEQPIKLNEQAMEQLSLLVSFFVGVLAMIAFIRGLNWR